MDNRKRQVIDPNKVKPSDYESYSDSIDFLSIPRLSPEIEYFTLLVSQSLPPEALLVDVGGGTGYVLERILDQRPDLVATLIEPATPMFQRAESRLEGRVRLLNASVESVIGQLEPQGAFIFCRSLYALGNYDSLFSSLARKLKAYGQIFILEPNTGPYNIPAYRLELEKQLAPPNDQELQHHWPVIKAALQRFNTGLQNGEFTLFPPQDLEQMAHNHGFEQVFYRSPGTFILRKRYI